MNFLPRLSSKLRNQQIKFFSEKIYKYITPKNTQDYHDKKVYESFKDNQKYTKKKVTSNIFAIAPIYPNEKQNIDLMEEKNIYEFESNYKVDNFLNIRNDQHKEIIKKRFNHKRKSLKKTDLNDNDVDVQTEDLSTVKFDPITNIPIGVGYDNFISKSVLDDKGKDKLFQLIQELTNKLGFVDFREFVALNKFILDAEEHKNIITSIKSKFLNLAIQRMNESKRKDAMRMFEKIEIENKDLTERQNKKINEVFKIDENSKELFYKFYYKFKETRNRSTEEVRDYEKRYDEMLKNLADTDKIVPHITDFEFKDEPQQSFEVDFTDDYMDILIKKYRFERTKKLKFTKEDILRKLHFYHNSPYRSYQSFEEVMKMIKYYAFFEKYKKLYVPTNMEVERIIHKFTKERQIDNFSYDEVYNQKDENFSDASDDPDYIEIDNKFSIPSPKTDKDFLIFNDESQKRIEEYDKIKKQYYLAKYNSKRDEFIKKIDEKISEELGIIFTDHAFEFADGRPDELMQPGPHSKPYNSDKNFKYSENNSREKFNFIDKLIEANYQNEKIDFMYQYQDFFSDKYKIRQRINQEIARKISLKEINSKLNEIITELRHEKGLNPLELPEIRYLDKTFTGKDFNLFETVVESFGEFKPDAYDNETIRLQNYTASYKVLRDIREKVELENVVAPPVSEYDLYEMEAFKSYKNDPIYKHYLYNHLSFFSEKISDHMSTLPFSMRGSKPQDYIRYEKIRLVEYNREKKLRKNAGFSVESGGNKESLLSIQRGNDDELEQQKETIQINRKTFSGFGKRKRSQAIVNVYPNGYGKITVNKIPFHVYFASPAIRSKVMIPLVLVNRLADLTVEIRVVSGGFTGQSEAIIPALSRALIQLDPSYEKILRQAGCVTHDPRNVERKKFGRIKARKSYVFRKR